MPASDARFSRWPVFSRQPEAENVEVLAPIANNAQALVLAGFIAVTSSGGSGAPPLPAVRPRLLHLHVVVF